MVYTVKFLRSTESKKKRSLIDLAQEINSLPNDEREQKILQLLHYVHDHPERKSDEPAFYI